jgi:DNA modification methylase
LANRRGPTSRFLNRIAIGLRQKIQLAEKISSRMVELDIARCRIERDIAADWIKHRNKINEELAKFGMSEAEWCRSELGCSIQTMRRRVQLLKGWSRYLKRRREVGDNGQYGLLYAAFLAAPIITTELAMNAQRASVRSFTGPFDSSRLQLITGDAQSELRKLPPQSVNVIVCSPPYWPPKRKYGNDRGLGFEETLPDYIRKLVNIFREARRVLRDDGTCWVIIDGAYMHRRNLYGQQPYQGRRSSLSLAAQIGMNVQDDAEFRLFGNLLFIPERFAMAMQDDGWLCRSEIIWDKGEAGRKEPVNNRPRRNFEKVLMFTKTVGYVFDLDPIREPLNERFYSTPTGRQKPGLLRMDTNRDPRVPNNPLGRNPGSVWRIPPTNYRGSHGATFPAELVRRLLLVSCPDRGRVLDPFGGAGTTALVALELGHDAISIDINRRYTEEARRRLARRGDVHCQADHQRRTAAADLRAERHVQVKRRSPTVAIGNSAKQLSL